MTGVWTLFAFIHITCWSWWSKWDRFLTWQLLTSVTFSHRSPAVLRLFNCLFLMDACVIEFNGIWFRQCSVPVKSWWKNSKALEWAAQGGGGVTDPGGVQGTFGRCVEGHGLMRSIGDGWMVGLGDPVGILKPWWFYDSMTFFCLSE